MKGAGLLALLVLLAFGGKRASGGKGQTRAGWLSMSELESLAADAGFPDPHLAAAVAMAESGGNPEAVGVGPKERSIGLWQINILVHKPPMVSDEAGLKVPKLNAYAARAIYAKAGNTWKPWGAYTNGSYKKYL